MRSLVSPTSTGATSSNSAVVNINDLEDFMDELAMDLNGADLEPHELLDAKELDQIQHFVANQQQAAERDVTGATKNESTETNISENNDITHAELGGSSTKGSMASKTETHKERNDVEVKSKPQPEKGEITAISSAKRQQKANLCTTVSLPPHKARCLQCHHVGLKGTFYSTSKKYCRIDCSKEAKKVKYVQRTVSKLKQPSRELPLKIDNKCEKRKRTPTKKAACLKKVPVPPKDGVAKKERKLKQIEPRSIIGGCFQETLQLKKTASQLLDRSPSLKFGPIRPKRSASIEPNTPVYDWAHAIKNHNDSRPSFLCRTPAITTPSYPTVAVSAFRHAPLSRVWSKLAQINFDSNTVVEVVYEEDGQKYFWFATILTVAGYYAVMSYALPHSFLDTFCLHLLTKDRPIYAVGRCRELGFTLKAPRVINKDYLCQDELHKRLFYVLKESITLDPELDEKLDQAYVEVRSRESMLKENMRVEIKDPENISQTLVAKVRNIQGERVELIFQRGDNAEAVDENSISKTDTQVWHCHQKSSNIHPVGWSEFVGHPIDATEDYKAKSLQSFITDQYVKDDASPDALSSRTPFVRISNSTKHFQPGMKLEAVDPLQPSCVRVATVKKVLRSNFLLIGFDGENLPRQKEYDLGEKPAVTAHCYHADSAYLLPAGFCGINNIRLVSPTNENFYWPNYLREAGRDIAPVALFCLDASKSAETFQPGVRIEAVDLLDSSFIGASTVVQRAGRLMRVRFDGWNAVYEQWMDVECPEVYPIGWAEALGHRIEGPPEGVNGVGMKPVELVRSFSNEIKARCEKRKAETTVNTAAKRKPDLVAALTGGSKNVPLKETDIVTIKTNLSWEVTNQTSSSEPNLATSSFTSASLQPLSSSEIPEDLADLLANFEDLDSTPPAVQYGAKEDPKIIMAPLVKSMSISKYTTLSKGNLGAGKNVSTGTTTTASMLEKSQANTRTQPKLNVNDGLSTSERETNVVGNIVPDLPPRTLSNSSLRPKEFGTKSGTDFVPQVPAQRIPVNKSDSQSSAEQTASQSITTTKTQSNEGQNRLAGYEDRPSHTTLKMKFTILAPPIDDVEMSSQLNDNLNAL